MKVKSSNKFRKRMRFFPIQKNVKFTMKEVKLPSKKVVVEVVDSPVQWTFLTCSSEEAFQLEGNDNFLLAFFLKLPQNCD